MKIRSIEQKDLDRILELSNQEAKWFGAEEKSFFERFLDSPYFLLIEENSRILGFVMALDQTTDYPEGRHFKWFKARYAEFIYIDRIAVDPALRRQGIGTKLYAHLSKIRNSTPLTCEVAIKPAEYYNQTSIEFHEKNGFKEVGTFSPDGKKVCRMYMKTE